MATGTELFDYLKKATADLQESRRRVRELESAAREPIAIVAMACRFPGGVCTPDQLWDLVAAGTNGVSPFPVDRGWDLASLYDPDPDRAGKSFTRNGGFIEGVADFDPEPFGMSPREALATDPQQRLLLEIALEAIEGAGIGPLSLRGSDTGVFVGVMGQDYLPRLQDLPEGADGHGLTGSAGSVASGRVSYVFGLRGPAVSVDTACSSSLVALHLAVQSLRNGECSLALAGGVTVMCTPGMFIAFSRQRGLSADGRCKAFGAGADGVGWGEGAGIVLLERLSDARRRGHPVLAVVRGSAVNQDGASNGLTAPSGRSQELVIRRALADADLGVSDVDVVEAHGTGTRLGDPIEAHALLATYGQRRPKDRPVWLGSLKSNIGHTQAAAGIGGVIKMVQAMRNGVLPRTLHADEPSPHVDWSTGDVRLLTEQQSWPETGRPCRAGVSSFGISGTNAHVIIEGVPEEEKEPAPASGWNRDGVLPFLLSAAGEAALRAQAARLGEFVAARPDLDLADIAWSLSTTRSALSHRAVVAGQGRDEVLAGLAGLANGDGPAAVSSGQVGPSVKLGLLFPGQGSQHAGMGRELYAAFPVFAAAFDAVCEQFDCPLRDIVFAGDEAVLGQTVFTQAGLFAVEVALFRLLESWGVRAEAVLGHSVGEIVAAHVSGMLSLADACVLVAARGRLMQALPPGGGMVAVEATEQEIRPSLGNRVSIAAVNGPSAVVISGDGVAVDDLAADWSRRGRRVTRLKTSHAFHSPLMEPMLAEFERVIRTLTFHEPAIPLISNVSGTLMTVTDPAYWVRHVRGTVRFADGIESLRAMGINAFLEVGPGATLTPMLPGCLGEDTTDLSLSLLHKARPEPQAAITAVGALYAHGLAVDWPALIPQGKPVPLPTYAFTRRRFWLPSLTADRAPEDDWRYRITWRPVTSSAQPVARTWLVVLPSAVDDQGWIGPEPVRVVLDAGTADRQLIGCRLREALAGAPPVDGVLSLLGLDQRPHSGATAPAGTVGTLALAQALGDIGLDAPLWLATRGAVALGDADRLAAPEQAQLWGLGRVIALEHPQRWGGLVDLPPRPEADVLGRLARHDGETELAIRGATVYARRLVRAERTATPADGWQPSGTVLVTGGTGALGGHVARWLAQAGAGHLVLISRRGPAAPGAAQLEAELRGLGAEVTVAACDAADREAMARLIADHPPSAVFHTAGALDDGVLDGLDADLLDAVFKPKVTAAAVLHELTSALPLSAFVLFSSVAGVLGNAGQAGYAAANAYLDALAEQRRADGLAATSVAWGAWAENGLAADAGIVEARLRHNGVLPMRPEPAIEALRQALDRGETTSVVVDMDWGRYVAASEGHGLPAWSRDLPEVQQALSAAGASEDRKAVLRRQLDRQPPDERARTLVTLVRTQAAAALHHSGPEAIPADRAFGELGFDSLTAIDLRNRLNAATGLRLRSTVVFDYPAARLLAAHLGEELLGAGTAEATSSDVVSVSDDDPIAIVSMSCRFPGAVASPEDFWGLLAAGGEARGEFPADRDWDIDALYNPDPGHVGTTYTRHGAFLTDAADFDAELFGISPREALAMDPQQRLLLETAWEAFERAGIDPATVRGSRSGVFVGTNGQDYYTGLAEVPSGVEGYLLAGNAASVLSGRLAYTFGLEGPAVTVDTACSSSLVAMHLAAQSLRQGECKLALAGGVTVMATSGAFVEFSRQRGLAADGRCKPFADAADGTAWGEGVGVLVLERLSDAQRNSHPVLAVIRGTAVNQDGASNGLTAPNGPSQQRVIRRALADAGLDPSDVDAVEAHGTGTALGDPIEAQALIACYGQNRDRPLWLGSVKSNIGHTQAAAGVAGVIKMVQAMRHGVLPRSLHVDRPSSHVDWSSGAVRLLTEAVPWPSEGRPRRAGVSSFGISGTNAHVILEHVQQGAADLERRAPLGPLPFVVSGRSGAALRAQAAALRSRLDTTSVDVPLVDIGFSLATTRSAHEHRAAVIAEDRAELANLLDALVDGRPAAGMASAGADDAPGGERKLAFVFSGQGSQRVGMGCELYERFPVFATALDEVCAELDALVGQSVREVMFEQADVLASTGGAQPALFAFEVALFRLVESWGVRPDVVAGHSVGEIAAAHVSGVLSLSEAAVLVATRGRLMQALPVGGAMVAIEAAEADVRPLLGADVCLAAVNGPTSTVVSGAEPAVLRVARHFARQGVRTKRLQVSHAFHSPLMRPMLAEFARVVDTLSFAPPSIPFVSTVTGGLAAAGEIGDPGYWVRHVLETVRFADAVRTLREEQVTALVEIGPDSTLAGLAADEFAVTAALQRKGRGEQRSAVTALASLWADDVPVDWAGLFADSGAQRVDLPTYAFQRRRYWMRTGHQRGDVGAAGLTDIGHPLLGACVPLADTGKVLFTGSLSTRTHPWLADHALVGVVVFPGTGYVELALQAGAQLGCDRADELTIEAPLVLPERGAVQFQLVVDPPDDSGRRPLTMYARQQESGHDGAWTRHAGAVLATGTAPEVFDLDSWPPADAVPIPVDGLYERIAAESGFDYGPAFQGMRRAWRRGDEIFTEVVVPSEQRLAAARFGLHPALLDAALHAVALRPTEDGVPGRGVMPFAWSGISCYRTGATALRVRMGTVGRGAVSLAVADSAGRPVASVRSVTLRPVAGDLSPVGSLFTVEWAEVPVAETPPVTPQWVVLDSVSVPDLAALGETVPGAIVLCLAGAADGKDTATAVRDAVVRLLALSQSWLADNRFARCRLVVVTRGAVDVDENGVGDLTHAGAWGLLRSAQTEHPGRFVLLDVDDVGAVDGILSSVLTAGEPQLSLRSGVLRAPRLTPVSADDALVPPAGTAAWRLEVRERGTVDGLALVADPLVCRPLGDGEIRVGMRAAGVNFRDVLSTLGAYPGEVTLGIEGAGVVTEVGPGVTGLAPGDAVMGLFSPAFGPTAVTDRRMVAPIPRGWSFEQAASVPVAFLTAYYGLVDLAGVRPGDSVLVHAAAGGVGMAAVQLATCLGAEVYGTASPGKWDTLRSLGIDAARIASSRSLDFGDQFREATGGRGMDIVLNSLAGEFVDTSLRLLAPGGRFLEMGKTDVRSATEAAGSYAAFDLMDAGPDRIRQMLAEVLELLAAGRLAPLPVRTWDVRRAKQAFRVMSQAKHIGKIVLTMPRVLDPRGTVLVTGASGALGSLVARHLAAEHGVRHLLLVSRRGVGADNAERLRAELSEAGAEVSFESCDVADPDALAEVLARVPAGHPLTGVVHSAGVLDDGVISALTADKVDTVLRAKVNGALNLHELTKDMDLAAFVLFSSVAGVFGGPGQGNYAAANAFLDALARHRRAGGLVGQSLAWGPWAAEQGMTRHVATADHARVSRAGLEPLSATRGLAMFDAALHVDRALVVPLSVNTATLRAEAGNGMLSPMLRGLVRTPVPRAAERDAGRTGGSDLAVRLADRTRPEQERLLLDLVRTEAAAVLGHASADPVDAERGFLDLGLDSLTALDLRNRLGGATGLRLSATVIFDYPTPAALAGQLRTQLCPDDERRENPAVEHQAPQVSAIDAMDLDDLVQLALDSSES